MKKLNQNKNFWIGEHLAGRDLVEWVTDQLLLLYTINKASEYRRLQRTRVHKIIFLSELDHWKKGIGGLDQDFIRLNNGPFSNEIRNDIHRLSQRSMIETYWGNRAYKILHDGNKILKETEELFQKNSHVLTSIDEKIEVVMEPSNLNELLEYVYKLPNPLDHSISIQETKLKKYLLHRERRSEITIPFDISQIDAESLEIILHPDLWNNWLESEKSIRKKPLIPFHESELFS